MFKIKQLTIENYKSIKTLNLFNLPQVCVFVGKNNTGKSVILEAVNFVRAMFSQIGLLDAIRTYKILESYNKHPQKDGRYPHEEIICFFVVFTNGIIEESVKIDIEESGECRIYFHGESLVYTLSKLCVEDNPSRNFLRSLITANLENLPYNLVLASTHDPDSLAHRTPEEVFYVDKEDGFTTVIQASRLKAVQELYKNGDNITDIWRQGFLEKEAQKFFGFVDK
jgi:hypothetical protein